MQALTMYLWRRYGIHTDITLVAIAISTPITRVIIHRIRDRHQIALMHDVFFRLQHRESSKPVQ